MRRTGARTGLGKPETFKFLCFVFICGKSHRRKFLVQRKSRRTSSLSNALGQLASNEGIYVDVKDFKVMKGQAKGDPTAQIAKLGARKVSDGAIIFRSGDAFYIVDTKPPTSTQ
jgi:hypothetical protein